ncbi:hypothetical protein PPL_05856 [Heterostelium album PN500]|uniref:GRAM domain-containing protein n=1 Tax=Heterostelium pallidum (strain ATCC 26659 / Pp 5 / PN500) TaxID=670386 RepID=D3BBI8_HETP5|nr:hypothetical protein PPL_05856 [Heterostelium album PN500]EFA81021.1 hypothetical protein PPL_05856 [Heterostelium album PN500]|eukprot:XP_020433139.1 hypothetical protein PPL_05856 [Heterostelium album PN500]
MKDTTLRQEDIIKRDFRKNTIPRKDNIFFQFEQISGLSMFQTKEKLCCFDQFDKEGKQQQQQQLTLITEVVSSSSCCCSRSKKQRKKEGLNMSNLVDNFFWKFSGEKIEWKSYSSKHTDEGPLTGYFYLTNYRFAFNPMHSNKKKESVEIPLGMIAKFERSTNKRDQIVEIHCKDIRILKFYFGKTDTDFLDEVEKRFHNLYPYTIEKAFAFFNQDRYPDTKGWRIYDAVQEYKRQGISTTSKISQWVITYSGDTVKGGKLSHRKKITGVVLATPTEKLGDCA